MTRISSTATATHAAAVVCVPPVKQPATEVLAADAAVGSWQPVCYMLREGGGSADDLIPEQLYFEC